MTDLYPVKPEFAAKARITREQYARDYQASINDPEAFWGRVAERLGTAMPSPFDGLAAIGVATMC